MNIILNVYLCRVLRGVADYGVLSVMKKYRNGSDLIQGIVALGDFVLLNIFLYVVFFYAPESWKTFLPEVFFHSRPTVFIVANFSMLIAQQVYPTIVHIRHVRFQKPMLNVAKLVLVQSVAMFVLLRMISGSGNLFNFLFFFAAAFYLVLMLARYAEFRLIHGLRSTGHNTRSVLLLGNDPLLIKFYHRQLSDSSTGYLVQGYYSDGTFDGIPEDLVRLGSIDDFLKEGSREKSFTGEPQFLDKIDEVFCCLPDKDRSLVESIMRCCDHHIIRFFYLPVLFSGDSIRLRSFRMDNYLVFTNHREPLSYPFNKLLKRSFDFAFSLVVCLCLLPFIPIIAFLIKRQSPGPIFFKQARTGYNGHTFMCYKFRSMHVNKDADTVQATEHDPRKFPFGDFMRRTDIDELPQFFNVLKGDMSVVGPRPHMLHHTEMYGQLIDKYMVRHFCKPGITGLAQTTGYRGETHELWQMEERVKLDIWYIENWTFWLDIKIIFNTVVSVFRHDKNAY